LTERRLDERHEWLCGAGDEVPHPASWRGLSAYAAGDSTASADGASAECAAVVARRGYDFFFICWHSPRQRARLCDMMVLARDVPAPTGSDGSQFI
jgi:hypothetical protein